MGSSSFSDTYMFTDYRGEQTAEEAYQTLCADALSEYGHNGYNGTISTTRGVHVRQASPVTMAEASRLDEQHCGNLDKWSHCEAVALVEEQPAQYGPATSHSFTIECTLTDANDRDALRRLAARHLSTRPERIGEVQALAFVSWNGALPWLPTSRLSLGAVQELVEMLADDAALQHVTRPVLLRALLTATSGTIAGDSGPREPAASTPVDTGGAPAQELSARRLRRLLAPQPSLPAALQALILCAALLLAIPTALVIAP